MLDFIHNNLGTIIVSAVLLLILAFAAYNAGPGRVSEWLEDNRYADGEGGLKKIPITETRRHVKKSMDAMDVYERLYGERYASSEEKAA